MLVFIPTIKYDTFIFDPDLPKYHYIQIGFKQVSIVQAPEEIAFYDDLKRICRHYGLRHYVTGTIHGAMGDTYNCMEILVSNTEKYFIMVLRSVDCYFIAHQDNEKYYFVGPKNKKIYRLKILFNQRTHWCDYIEEVMKITNVNPNNNS